jgi:hypothetical protein
MMGRWVARRPSHRGGFVRRLTLAGEQWWSACGGRGLAGPLSDDISDKTSALRWNPRVERVFRDVRILWTARSSRRREYVSCAERHVVRPVSLKVATGDSALAAFHPSTRQSADWAVPNLAPLPLRGDAGGRGRPGLLNTATPRPSSPRPRKMRSIA